MIDLTSSNATNNEKTNPDTVAYGTKDGKIHFGYLYAANINGNSASSIASVHLQGFHSLHYLSMIKTGPMQGSTINRSPGPYQVICATDHAGSVGDTQGIGYFLFADNGDIVIRAPNGRVRISGMDVDIRAEGPDSSRGSINIESNQSLNIKTGSIDIKSTLGGKIFTPKSIDIVANTSLNLISNFTRGLTSISSIRPAKNSFISNTTQKFISNQGYL